MENLIERVRHYDAIERPRHRDRFRALAEKQSPSTFFLGCSDSRIAPSLVAGANPGELFVVRNVANLVPPAGTREDASVAAALFFALTVLEVSDVVVCGHSGCGGINAVLGSSTTLPEPLRRWLEPANRSLETWYRHGPLDATRSDVDQLSQISTLVQVDNLLTHDFVSERLAAGKLRIHPWWFDIARGGKLLGYSHEANRFVDAVDALAEVGRAEAAE